LALALTLANADAHLAEHQRAVERFDELIDLVPVDPLYADGE
jgi:hypothetical protein